MTPPAQIRHFSPSDPDRTLLDRVRQSGLADDLVGRMDLRLKRKGRRRRRVARAAVAAGCLALALAWGVPWLRSTARIANSSPLSKTVALADGSSVELSGRTEIATDFRYGRRRVRLVRGEAYFTVATGASHPFVVEMPVGTIRVLGTRFDVRLVEEDRAEVTLLEGAIAVEVPHAEASRLAPGQRLVVGAGMGAPRGLTPAELEDATAWRTGRIALDGTTLAEAAARLAALHGCPIRVDPRVASIRIGGTYPLGDLPKLMEALASTQAVRVRALPDGSYALLPP